MKTIINIAIGGALGALCRFGLGQVWFTQMEFPMSTLFINGIGSYFLGWLLNWVVHLPKWNKTIKLMFGTGFAGAFTTFSTFSLETIQLIQAYQYGWSLVYIVVSVLGGVLLSFAGWKCNDWMQRRKER